MSVEFRQRTPSEYVQILWKRKWLIVLPAIAVFLAVAWVVLRLPNVFESSTLLTVRPATISSDAVPQLSDSDLTLRINNIGQIVVSRSSLEPLIIKHDLYAVERRRGTPMDALVERMKTRDITVQINTSRNDITNGFNLSFRGPTPQAAKAVTAELASKYVNAQTKEAVDEALQTREFFDAKLRQAKDELDAIDSKRLQVMMANKESLPSSSSALVERLTGLYEQQKTYVTEIGRLRDQITAQSNLLGDTDKQRTQEILEVAQQIGDPKTTPAYAELMKRKAEHESQKQVLLGSYRPKHPDVINKQQEIESVQRQMDEFVEDNKRKVEERRKQLEQRVDLRITTYKNNIRGLETELVRQQTQVGLIENQIRELERRINNVPGTEVALGGLDREYESRKSVYDNLLSQQQKAMIVADASANQQGESIMVIDAASLPELPVAPNRPLLIALGLLAGLGVGLTFTAAREVPRLLTVQTLEDATHYTGLPVLITVPELFTPREKRRQRYRRVAFALVAVALTIASVPALALALKLSRVIEIFALRG